MHMTHQNTTPRTSSSPTHPGTDAGEDPHHQNAQKPRETTVENAHTSLLPPRDEADHDAPITHGLIVAYHRTPACACVRTHRVVVAAGWVEGNTHHKGENSDHLFTIPRPDSPKSHCVFVLFHRLLLSSIHPTHNPAVCCLQRRAHHGVPLSCVLSHFFLLVLVLSSDL